MKLFSLLALLALISCGNSSTGAGHGTSNRFTQNETAEVDGSNIKGIYAATIYPVNVNLQFSQVGMAVFQREGDEFSATVKMKYAPKGIAIKQAIYTGRRCPNINDDLNKDAYIDIQEALVAIGDITIPLDGNLDSQQAGLYDFPAGDMATGKYTYEVKASFERMFADLRGVDENPYDNIVKLGEGEGLTFPGRIVLFQGLNEEIYLPPTVASTPGESVYRTLPVACGVLWKEQALPTNF